MVEQSKAELIAELDRTREQLARSLHGVAHRLDLHARFRESVGRNKALWFSGAAVAGWILSRIPSRRKKHRVDGGRLASRDSRETRNAGVMLSLLKLGITLLKPAITAIATKKIAAIARGDFHETRTR